MRQADLGHRRHGDARLEAAADGVVLGHLPDGTHSNGISALQLGNQPGLGSYKSAWLLYAKLRRAMVAPGRSPLAGLAEVDETEIPLSVPDEFSLNVPIENSLIGV